MDISKNRKSEPTVLHAGSGVEIRSCGLINSSGVDFMPSGFRIDYQGKVIYIDPIVLSNFMPADFILITHSHPDHFSRKTIRKIAGSDTKIICPAKMVDKITKLGFHVTGMEPGDVINEPAIRFEAVPAYNTRSAFLGLKAHPRSANFLGYVIKLDNISIYHTGDSHFVDEIKNLENITVALVPLGNGKLTMDNAEAADMLNYLHPKIAVPMHYEPRLKDNINRFRELVDDSIEIIILE